MICYVCDKQNFHSMGDINTQREILVCKECGNVCFHVEPQDEIKIRDYYRKEYRPAPNFTNLLTTTNKQNYIMRFLSDFLKDKKGLIIGDVGCATGYIPAYLRGIGHRATGSEWTVTFRRFAEHYYGVPVTEELESKHKYDLIIMYHTLEHMIEPDKKLKRYRDMLADDGHMMISTPEWFDVLEEAGGSPITSFEHLFHKDHINLFSPYSLKNIFLKEGLEIIKEDHLVYGQTYLLKKCDPKPIIKENYKERIEQIKKAKQAITLYSVRRYKEATEIWKKFPEAWIAMVEGVHHKDPTRQADILEQSKLHLRDNLRLRNTLGVWLYKQDRIKEALEVFKENLTLKPVAQLYYYIGTCLMQLNQPKQAMPYFQNASLLDPSNWREYVGWTCKAASACPTWDEIATQRFQQYVLEQNKEKINLENPDPIFNGEKKELNVIQSGT